MDAHPLFTWLQTQVDRNIDGNFCKFLVDARGNVKRFYAANADPQDLIPELAGMLE